MSAILRGQILAKKIERILYKEDSPERSIVNKLFRSGRPSWQVEYVINVLKEKLKKELLKDPNWGLWIYQEDNSNVYEVKTVNGITLVYSYT